MRAGPFGSEPARWRGAGQGPRFLHSSFGRSRNSSIAAGPRPVNAAARPGVCRRGGRGEIEPGMRVLGADGEWVGTVSEVLADQASGIFHGLAVRHGLFGDTRLVAD